MPAKSFFDILIDCFYCKAKSIKANLINNISVGFISRCCHEHNIRLIHISTDFVFNGKSNIPYKESDFTSPINIYGKTKLLGENKIKENNKKAKKNSLPMQPGDVVETFADIDELQKDFGFKPSTSIETGINRFVDWYLDKGENL